MTKRPILSLGIVGVLGVIALGCGGGGDMNDMPGIQAPGAFKASCNNQASLSKCSENFDAAFFMGEEFIKGLCDMVEGKYSTDRCSTADLVGTCDDGSGTTHFYYSTGDMAFTAESGKADCEQLDWKWKAN